MFRAMETLRDVKPSPLGYTQNNQNTYHQHPDRYGDQPYTKYDLRSPANASSQVYNGSAKLQGNQGFTDTKGTQCESFVNDKRNFSPEAIRAVQEYKERKEREAHAPNRKDQSAGQSQIVEPLNFNHSTRRPQRTCCRRSKV